jgi:hypothetical protein
VVSSPFSIALAAFKANEGYWQSAATNLTATAEWQEFETAVSVPAQGSPEWKPFMSAIWPRFDANGEEGQLAIDDLQITQAEALDEWQSWQQDGWDRHSIVADPLFLDAAKDDFRLNPESPAIQKLGFQPLPIAEMGLVEDEWRQLSR